MAEYIYLSAANKGWRIPEPPLFLLRTIIGLYGQLAGASDNGHAPLLRRLLVTVFGWRGYWLFYRLPPKGLIDLVVHLPATLGLEAGSEATAGTDSWGDVYAHLSATFGWDYDTIDRCMTLSRLKALHHYLRQHPPTHLLVAAYLDYQPPLSLAEKRRRFFDRFTQ